MNAAEWKAPERDGGILVSPGLDQLVDSTRENQQQLSKSSAIISDKPLNAWRQQMRRLLGHTDTDQPLICSGHQAELYHPGVWIKLAVIDRIAKKMGGRALQMSVDLDAPKHLQLRWPGGGTEISPDIKSTAAWVGLIPLPSQQVLRSALNDVQRASDAWKFQSLLPDFLHRLAEISPSRPNLGAALAASMQQLDQHLGLSYDLHMGAEICKTEPYMAFVSHILANAQNFAEIYNRALAKYRMVERIKSPGRPMPDLAMDNDQIELPFWLDDLASGSRQRLSLSKNSLGLSLITERGTLNMARADPDELSYFCAANHVRIAPRALTLTMFLRLFVCDQWIHGIGGARYDRVTDDIIRDFFRITPPTFGVATATLYFPTAADRSRTQIPLLLHAGHHLKHQVLGAAKTNYLQQISVAPRRSPQRAELFSQMHREMETTGSPELATWIRTYQTAQLTAAEDRALFDRELFYALQPTDRLNSLLLNVK